MRFTAESEPAKEYAADLSSADTLEKLTEVMVKWRAYAAEAEEIVLTWTEDDFREWRDCVAMERAGYFVGEENAERFGAVFLPNPLLTIASMAHVYHSSFIEAEQRLILNGYLRLTDGKYAIAYQEKE